MPLRRRLAQVAAAALLLPTTAVLTVADSAAASVPASVWNTTLTDIPRPAHMLTTPDGGVNIGCSATGNTTVKSFDASGSVAQSIGGSGASWPDMCAPHSAVGKDGTVYTYADVNNFHGSALVAYKDGNLVWSYSPPCSGGVNAIAIGTNGNVYFVATSWGSCPALAVIGLTPTAVSGTTSPQVVLNQAITNDFVFNGELSAYAGGVVVRGYNSIQYVTYAGSVTSVNLAMSDPYGPQFNVGTDSTAALPLRPNSAEASNCNVTYGGWGSTYLATAIAVYAMGTLQWGHDLPDCAKVYEVQPTPGGGFVAHVRVPRLGAAPLDYLLAIGPGDTALWSYDVSLPSGVTSQNLAFTADLNGNVAVQRNVWLAGTGSGSGYQFPAVNFKLLDGTTGVELTSLDLNADPSTSSGPSYLSTDMSQVVIAHNRLYLAVHACTNMQGCNQSSSTLYAFAVPGLHMDYPRGAVLEYDKPWLNYVAMGDSFSSGEGVPSFLEGTDTNGPPKNVCHRSEKAYSRLLDDLPGPRLNLTAFVACSGAKTAQITGPWAESDNKNSNESAQKEALSASTDVVSITIGGNDVEFKQFATRCVLADCYPYGSYYLGLVNNLGPTLESTYNAILGKAPNAQIYVIGYPLLLSPNGCPQIDGWMHTLDVLAGQAANNNPAAIAALMAVASASDLDSTDTTTLLTSGHVEFSSNELGLAHDFTTDLNAKSASVVQALRNTGKTQIHYIDPVANGSPFLGNGLCSDNSYFNGIEVGGNAPYTLHPNAEGQDAYRQLLLQYL